jgi:hypothetical protein
MTNQNQNLTGVWHGLYSYEIFREPVYFVATLIHGGTLISGTTHESEIGETGAPLTLFAGIDGSKTGTAVTFRKTYDGSDGWNHSVDYEGLLNGEGTEIEGRWIIPGNATGRFLMIRNRGATESVVRQAFEKA